MTKSQLIRLERLERKARLAPILDLKGVPNQDLKLLEGHFLAIVVLEHRRLGKKRLPRDARQLLAEYTKPMTSYLLPRKKLEALLAPAMQPASISYRPLSRPVLESTSIKLPQLEGLQTR